MTCPAVVRITVPSGPAVARVATPGPPGPLGLPQQRRHDWVAPYSYCGVAAAGVAESAAGWKVTRLTISTTGVVSATGLANPVTWTGRLGHSYS
jgi:hypothetical protein